MQLLGQFTETEHKTTHRIYWITTQNEYNHNYIATATGWKPNRSLKLIII
jgi:hypothetical protein